METELWPNMLHFSAQKKIPVILANARLSEKSYQRYKKVIRLVTPMFNCITAVAAQSRDDYRRFLELGMPKAKVFLTGNVKFDLEVSSAVIARGAILRNWWGRNRPIWIAGSTHPGEEEKILTALKVISKTIPEVLLVLVPRHPERFNTVFALCQAENFIVVRYSEKVNETISSGVQVILGDVMGQLLTFYAASDIAFVGGSLVKLGGHNLLEPAALAKPVLSGPNLHAFAEIKLMLLDHDALIIVKNENELALKIIELLQNKELCNQYGARSLDVVMENRGATQKIVAMVQIG
jgi:3-deoxy-D-manno-octulosonic-acid transferase